ncbi:MAG: exo-alpha-sialidase [Ardenticatenaceae bacterium]|nr:exo-alpha-sialidase [Ardenticatenaceae bacterium]
MIQSNLKRFLPLVVLLGLTVYLSGRADADVVVRDIPHAPDWDVSSPVLISDTANPNVNDRPYIAAGSNGNKLIIVYNRKMGSGNDKDPYFSRSTNGGQSWSSPAPIHTSLGEAFNSLEVNIEIDANNVGHAVWVEANNTIMYSKEGNWGNNSPTPIYNAIVQASSPQIVASGSNTLDLIWTAADFGLTQVWHRRSTDGGNTWSSENAISPDNVEALFADVDVDDNGNLHVAWEQTDSVHPQTGSFIYYTKGTVAGSSINWSTPVRVGDVSEASGPFPADSRSARRMVILTDGNRVHVAFTTFWEDEDLNDSQWVHYATCYNSCQSSSNWTDDVSISGEVVSVNDNSPKYIVSDILKIRGCTHVYFHGIDDTLEENEILLGVNSCDAWAANGRDGVTSSQNQSLHTSLVATDDHVHIVYEQTGDDGSTRQIFYRRGTPPPFNLYLPVVAR